MTLIGEPVPELREQLTQGYLDEAEICLLTVGDQISIKYRQFTLTQEVADVMKEMGWTEADAFFLGASVLEYGYNGEVVTPYGFNAHPLHIRRLDDDRKDTYGADSIALPLPVQKRIPKLNEYGNPQLGLISQTLISRYFA